MRRKLYYITILFSLSLIAISCGSSSPSSPSQEPIAIEGTVQKGPFILGSTVYIQELEDDFNPTGHTYFTQTTDDLGSFSVGTQISKNYVEITSQGFYFNEVSGNISDASISLNTLSELSSGIHVNLLTTLAKNRTGYLISNGGKTFTEARQQSEGEILENIFHIEEENLEQFDKMDISQDGTSNAILLAASAILQGSNTVGELSELVSKIINDTESDGTLDKTTYTDELIENNKYLSLCEIRKNLEDRYEELELTEAVIPKFEDYVDSDGDGTINKNDDDTFFWCMTNSSAPWVGQYGRYEHTSLVFDDKIWILGGYNSGFPHGIANDVWYSSDGVDWTEATSSAAWSPRATHTSVAYDGRMWVMGGSSFENTFNNDVWYSTDGASWTEATASASWPKRYGHSSIVFDNKMWVLGGTGTRQIGPGNWAAYALTDVWYSTNGVEWTQATATAPIPSTNYAIVVYDNKMWVIGGNIGWSFAANVNVYYSSDGANWTKATDSAPWGWRLGPASFVFDGKIWLIGGQGSTITPPIYNGDVWYSTDGVNWSQPVDRIHWSPSVGAYRYYLTSGVLGTKAFILGGTGCGEGDYCTDVWYYTKYSDYEP